MKKKRKAKKRRAPIVPRKKLLWQLEIANTRADNLEREYKTARHEAAQAQVREREYRGLLEQVTSLDAMTDALLTHSQAIMQTIRNLRDARMGPPP